MDENAAPLDSLTIGLTSEMRTQLEWLAERSKRPISEIAREFLAAELEAQYGLSKGEFRRKYLYRA